MDPGMIAFLGSQLIGGMMQADSAESAASAQQQSTEASIRESRRQYDLSRTDLNTANAQTRADLAPWRTAGGAAIGRLSDLLGLQPGADTTIPGASVGGAGGGKTLEQITQELRSGAQGRGMVQGKYYGTSDEGHPYPMGTRLYRYPDDTIGNEQIKFQGVDENAIGQEAQRLFDAQGSQTSAPVTAAQTAQAQAPGSDFGSLNAPISPAKKFTLADFWDDPVTKASYQQGLDQGTKALTNMAGARGSLNSGATLKALERFGIDYTGNQAGESEGRFTRNENNIYGREVARRDTLFNRLSGVAGTGQTAATNTANMGQSTANTVATMGQNTANTIGGMLTAQGNARGAAAIAGGNAMGGALSNIGNYYRQQQTIDKLIKGRDGGGYTNPYGSGGYMSGSDSMWTPYAYGGT